MGARKKLIRWVTHDSAHTNNIPVYGYIDGRYLGCIYLKPDEVDAFIKEQKVEDNRGYAKQS